jgi:hypothetical protein
MSSAVWASRGQTIADLIKQLERFESQDMEVRISLDGGDTSVPISLVGKIEGTYALLMNCEDAPTELRHR